MRKSEIRQRLRELEEEYANLTDQSLEPALYQQIQDYRRLYKSKRIEPEIWMIMFSVVAVLLGFIFGGGFGVAVTFCPLAVFWFVGYGLIWKIALNK